VVDRSLETLAADRGITICFADLDGVDGLWLPEERTILVNSRLADRRAAEVLDHELSHVAIEDGHAELDATVRRTASRTRFVFASAVASLVLLVGVWLQVAGNPDRDPRQGPTTVADHTTAPPHTEQPRPATPPVAAPTTKVVIQVANGEVRTQTVTVPAPTTTAARTSAGVATRTVAAVTPAASAGRVSTPTPTTSAAPPPTTTPAPTPTATVTPTPSATIPAATSAELPEQK
jgi:hypothetical protein